jgi:tetratricopeptide (TPR) repeat protein
MKVAHLNPSHTGSVNELMEKATGYEADKDYHAAISVYQALLKKQPLHEKAYTRLMILYRKLRDYGAEAKTIHDAIARFQEEAGGRKNKPGVVKPAGKIEKLSLSLGKLTGLIDKKGKSVYDPEPIASWKKRLILVNKKKKSSLSKTGKHPKTKKRSKTKTQ